MLRNTESRYGVATRLLHWSVAALILGLVWLGWYMVGLTYYDAWYNDSLVWHKALGIVALALGALNIVLSNVASGYFFTSRKSEPRRCLVLSASTEQQGGRQPKLGQQPTCPGAEAERADAQRDDDAGAPGDAAFQLEA